MERERERERKRERDEITITGGTFGKQEDQAAQFIREDHSFILVTFPRVLKKTKEKTD